MVPFCHFLSIIKKPLMSKGALFFFLGLKYEVIITNIVIHIDSFLVKLGVILQTCIKALETNNQFCDITF
jgi:hypothetical protein